MANAIQMVVKEEASETVLFVKMTDHFFDCLNVNNFSTGKKKRKVFQDSYRSPSDFRFKVNFMKFHYISLAMFMYLLAVVERRISSIFGNMEC